MIIADELLTNADWLRSRQWDILPATADAFLRALEVYDKSVDEQRKAIQQFMLLPAAIAMPNNIKEELIKNGLLIT
jgi:hypothetical protein